MRKSTDSDRKKGEKWEFDFKNINKDRLLYIWKNHKKIIVSITFISFLFMGYLIGTPKNNRQEVVEELEVALKIGNINKLDKIIKVNGNKVSKKELEPFSKYFLERSNNIPEFIKLVSEGKSKMMDIKREKTFLGENYYVNLKTFDLKVTSNLQNTDIKLDGKKIEEGTVISGVIPGEYSLVALVDTKYGIIKETGEISVLDNTNINLELKGDNITVKSEHKDAVVLINGISSNKTVNEFKNVGPIPMDGSVLISIEKEFPWGKIKGSEVVVKNSTDIKLTLDMANDELWIKVGKSINEFYESVFLALTNGNKEEIKSTVETKNKVYSILEKNYIFLKNKYSLKEVVIDKEKSHFEYKDGNYIGSIVCDIDYIISKDIFGIIGIQTSKENKKFFTKVTFKDGKWIISDIENFSL
ncbi:MAG: TcaA 3rd/4th domain-containing protein [Clostridium sp.]|uniref:TcaA 3rd/4th domain-containing protein n=1 Tax=Clostridium sp. TaxID=1506 RepID=UPI003EE61FBC